MPTRVARSIKRHDVWWAMFFAYQFGKAVGTPHPNLPLLVGGIAGLVGIVVVVVGTWGHS